MKGMKLQRNKTKQPSTIEDAISNDRSRLDRNLDGKRRSEPTKHWLDYETSQLQERRRKLHSKIIKKSSAVDELLYSSRNVEAVQEQMTQVDDKCKMLMEVHKKYNSLLPLEMQEQDGEWFDDVDEDMLSFNNKINNWIKDAELERRATMKQRALVCSRSGVSKKSVSRKLSSSSSSQRSSKSDMALKEKLKMAELLAEAEFIEKKQLAKINEEKPKLEEKLAKSKRKVKILEDPDIEEGERFHYDDVYSW